IMADFIDRHASESDASDSDAGSAKSSRSTGDSTDSDEEPVAKKQKKETKKRKGSGGGGGLSKKEKKKRKINSSDEDDEEDEDEDEQAKEEMRGFLVDEPEEEEDEGNQSDRSGKSKEKLDSDLDDDDLELIQENLDVKGVKKKGRTARIEDSDEEEEDRDKISKEIFGLGDDDDEPQSSRREPMRRDSGDERSDSDSEGGDNFIEYEQDERRGMKQRNRKRKEMNFAEGALDEARDIFGVEDFNFDEFYEEGGDGEAGEEEEYDDDDMEGDERPRVRRARTDKPKQRETLLDTMEPSELEKGYFAAEDKGIQQKDVPERFQVRQVKVTEASEEEVELEARWIYAHAFKDKPLTKQDDNMLQVLQQEGMTEDDAMKIDEEAPTRIKETLKYFRNSNFEVPFIGFYRKEGIADLLQINDLWKVYKWDSKWCHLLNRRNKLIALMRRMQTYLEETGEQHHHPLTDGDFYDVEAVQTNESLADVQTQFQLFYGPDLAKMTEWEHQRRLESEAMDEEGEGGERGDAGVSAKYKQATRKDKYQMCVEYGLGELAARFGLTPKQFAENLDWRRHDVEQDPVDPYVAAEDYITTSFSSVQDVIQGAQFMLAKQISREPLARSRMRDHYRRRAVISVRPTLKGRETMDDSHPMWKKRYIKEKPICDLEGDDYLQYHLLRESGVLEVRIEVDRQRDGEMQSTLLETICNEQPFHRDEYTEVAESWNVLRRQVVEMALQQMLFPELKIELEKKLLEEAKEWVVKRCSEAMYTRLLHSSYKPPKKIDGDDDDDDDRDGEVRVFGVVYSTERDEVSFGALIDQDGVVIDTIRLPYLMNRRGPQEERQKKEDMAKLARFVNKHVPHVIAVAGENLQARFVKKDMEEVVMQLFQENKITSNIQVVIHDNDAAKVYMQSKQAIAEHPDYPPNLRQALSLARCLLDPLVEYAHLYNTDEDIFCLSLHPLQADVNKEDLHEAVMLELINRVNEVGVDINKCVEFSHHSGLLQFVCGLGPRKASYLLKTIRQNSSCLESRTKLVTLCKIGPKVFMNCSGFIKIDTMRISERTDAYVEILDGSRVHPETYEWARKMAVDALEVDDTTDPTAALEEVLQSPERLKDLDLDAFAEELARQGFGKKDLTLYDIRSELFCRYKDLRSEYQEPNQTQLFGMLTKETCSTLFTGKLVTGTVERVVYRRVNPNDDRDRAEPIRDENSDSWKCPYCGKIVVDVSLLFNHYDEQDLEKGGCPGSPVGIRLRLDNGLIGFISNKCLSDNPNFKSPADRVKLRQVIHARVLKVDPDRYSVDLSSKSSDLRRDDWFDKDSHWDDDAEQADKRGDEEAADRKKQSAANQFVKRVISHPNFHNVTYKDAERMLSKLEQGDAIIRPSSKSANNLTVTWKVSDGIYCHVDVQEQEKINQFTLGKKLVIGGVEEFEDLEEILSRYIQPMASYCREALNHRYALENSQSEKKDEIDAHLHTMKRENPNKIPYCFTPSAVYPGKFTLNYLVGKLRQEYFTPQPEGLRFRKQLFNSLEQMLGWFKLHYREMPAQMYGNRGGYR
ncbi:hypothetical protein PENTCL1PPCAC_12216, partial [Pristionchus entomophagus]